MLTWMPITMPGSFVPDCRSAAPSVAICGDSCSRGSSFDIACAAASSFGGCQYSVLVKSVTRSKLRGSTPHTLAVTTSLSPP